MKKFLSVLLVFSIVPISLIFSACVPTIDDVAGMYKLVEIYSEGRTYKVGDTFNERVLERDDAVLILNKDETFSATYVDLDHVSTINGKWKKEENIVVFTSSGFATVELPFEIRKNGDLLLIIENASVLLLSKQQII